MERTQEVVQTGSGGSLASLGSAENDLGHRSPVGRTKFHSPRSLRLSRASSREQILNEFSRGGGAASSGDTGRPETTVWFEVHVDTAPGDFVVVTGNHLSLGFWDPRTGTPLTTHASTYPRWTAVATVPSGVAIEYKYVILHVDGTFKWEENIANRVFTAEGAELRLDDGEFNVQKVRALNTDYSANYSTTANRRKRVALTAIDNSPELPIDANSCIYVATYRLPLVTTHDPATGKYEFEWMSFAADDPARENGGVLRSTSRHGLYIIENLRALRSRCKVWYVGGLAVDVPRESREAVSEQLAKNFQCIPVFLEADEAQEFEDFCHSTLKPLFHFVQPTSKDMCKSYEKTDGEGSKWQLYCGVNLKFVTAVVQNFNDGDFVFAFDLELMMTPTLIGSRARTANICFFFNTPFPSSEIFRALPVRKDVLRSLLNANMIQFHCFTYARHFLSNCSSLLGLEYQPARGGLLHLNYNGHHVHIRACHVGIDANTLTRRLQEATIQQHRKKWSELFKQMRRDVVVMGYDDLEPLSGIALKLTALRKLLSLFPVYKTKLLLVQVGITLYDSRGEVMHADYIEQIKKHAEDMNRDFPDCCLLLFEKMPFARRNALFAMSDLYCNSSVRHGLSLVPFEYVLACSAQPGAKMGSLVISEFAACSRVIPGTMKVNPYRDEDFARAVHRCLEQPLIEKQHWQEQQSAWCKHNTVQLWAETIVVDLNKVRESMMSSGEDAVRSTSCRVGLTKSTYKEISAQNLRPELVYSAYANSQLQRLVIVDVDLLIRPKDEMRESVKEALCRALLTLAAEANTHVFLLSSERRDMLLQWLGEVQGLEHVGLAAEDGYYYKWPNSPPNRWDVRQQVNGDWKDVCKVLMEQYTERTTGTLIESDKVACITWHYGTSHPDWGRMQGKELLNQLKETLAHLPVEVLIGKSFVKVRHMGVTKGALVGHVLSHYGLRGGVDFILCLGDDSLDNGMYTLVKDFSNNQGDANLSLFACTVGKQPSVATHCLYTLEEAHELICGLSLQSKRKTRGLRSASTMLELSGRG